MSNFQFHFERLLNFAKQHNILIKPNEKICFFFIRFANYQETLCKIQKKSLIFFKDFEVDFDTLLNQGHSWINLSLVGYLGEILLIEVDFPNYENNCPKEKVSVNLSLQQHPNFFDVSSSFQLV